jgi:hypothetical protein
MGKSLTALVIVAALAVSMLHYSACREKLTPCQELASLSVNCMMTECQSKWMSPPCVFCSTCVLQPNLDMCNLLFIHDAGVPYVCDDYDASQTLFVCDQSGVPQQIALMCQDAGIP